MGIPSRYNYHAFWNVYNWNPDPMEEYFPLIQSFIPDGAQSVLDVGSGDGRYVPCFRGFDYTGIDISDVYTKRATVKYPGHTFIRGDILHFKPSDTIYDVVFTSVALQHLWPEVFPQVAENLNRIGRRIIMIESLGPVSKRTKYFFKHDYRKHFDVIHEQVFLPDTQNMLFVANSRVNPLP